MATISSSWHSPMLIFFPSETSRMWSSKCYQQAYRPENIESALCGYAAILLYHLKPAFIWMAGSRYISQCFMPQCRQSDIMKRTQFHKSDPIFFKQFLQCIFLHQLFVNKTTAAWSQSDELCQSKAHCDQLTLHSSPVCAQYTKSPPGCLQLQRVAYIAAQCRCTHHCKLKHRLCTQRPIYRSSYPNLLPQSQVWYVRFDQHRVQLVQESPKWVIRCWSVTRRKGEASTVGSFV